MLLLLDSQNCIKVLKNKDPLMIPVSVLLRLYYYYLLYCQRLSKSHFRDTLTLHVLDYKIAKLTMVKTSSKTKRQLKERIALGLKYGLQVVEEVISEDTSIYNELINFKSQFNDLNSFVSKGLSDYGQIYIKPNLSNTFQT